MVTLIASFGLKLALLWMAFCATRLLLLYCLAWMPADLVVSKWVEEERLKQIVDELQAYRGDLMYWFAGEPDFIKIAWAQKLKDLEERYPQELVYQAASRLNATNGENLLLFHFEGVSYV